MPQPAALRAPIPVMPECAAGVPDARGVRSLSGWPPSSRGRQSVGALRWRGRRSGPRRPEAERPVAQRPPAAVLDAQRVAATAKLVPPPVGATAQVAVARVPVAQVTAVAPVEVAPVTAVGRVVVAAAVARARRGSPRSPPNPARSTSAPAHHSQSPAEARSVGGASALPIVRRATHRMPGND